MSGRQRASHPVSCVRNIRHALVCFRTYATGCRLQIGDCRLQALIDGIQASQEAQETGRREAMARDGSWLSMDLARGSGIARMRRRGRVGGRGIDRDGDEDIVAIWEDGRTEGSTPWHGTAALRAMGGGLARPLGVEEGFGK